MSDKSTHNKQNAASVHDTSWSETILRLHVGEHAPVGYEIKRVVGHVQEPSGIGGTSWRDVYVVACRKCAMSSHDSAAAPDFSKICKFVRGIPPRQTGIFQASIREVLAYFSF